MWGRAGQTVLAVIAIILLHPVSPMVPTAEFGPFVHSGRAFPNIADRKVVREAPRMIEHRTPHAYARLVSHQYVAPADRNAVIVGINNARGTPPLPGSVRDATHLNAALLRYGFRGENISLLLNEQATRPAILSALRTMAARTPANGIAVFAIATHTRRSGGTNQLATAEGARISAHELASHLAAVRSRTWIAMPTCYAGGYALPGIVGPNRIATFSSSANEQSYQAGAAGSFLFIHMVRRAMLESHAPYSVESAFAFAQDEIQRQHPDHVPSISDGIAEDLVLGPSAPVVNARWEPPQRDPEYRAFGDSSYQSEYESGPDPSPTPGPYRRRGPASVCGSVTYNCSR
jgi:hypothetical protein